MLHPCNQCGHEFTEPLDECPRCGVVFAKLRTTPDSPRPGSDDDSRALAGSPRFDCAPASIERDGARAMGIGLGLAVLLLAVPFLGFVLSYMTILVHELGHAAAGWIFGYPSVPAFDFRYGGGLTSHEKRQLALLVVAYLAIGAALFHCRRHPPAVIALSAMTLLYTLTAFTELHQILIVFMGHGFELLFAGIFFYRALSGAAVKLAVERPLYAMLGFFIVFGDLRFAWGLIHDPAERAMYEEAKGGGHWMDFSVLAEQHFGVELQAVAGLFFIACLLPLVGAWLMHRHRERVLTALSGLLPRQRQGLARLDVLQ